MKMLTAVAALAYTDGSQACFEIRAGWAYLNPQGIWILNEPQRPAGTPHLLIEGGAATKYTDPRVRSFEKTWAAHLGARTLAELP